jgi:hypothetical protein
VVGFSLPPKYQENYKSNLTHRVKINVKISTMGNNNYLLFCLLVSAKFGDYQSLALITGAFAEKNVLALQLFMLLFNPYPWPTYHDLACRGFFSKICSDFAVNCSTHECVKAVLVEPYF